MNQGKAQKGHGMWAVHLIGVSACLVIAGGSLYFAGSSVSARRGVFLSARHELASTKGLLNKALAERTSIESQVNHLKADSEDQLPLMSVKTLNARTVKVVSFAEQAHIRIDSLQPGELITDHRVPVLPMELKGQASAEHIFEFLELLSGQMSDIHVQRIELVNDNVDSSNIQISLGLYWFVDPATKSE